MPLPNPVMTTHAATPYRLQPRSFQINRAMLPQALHGFVIVSLQLYHLRRGAS